MVRRLCIQTEITEEQAAAALGWAAQAEAWTSLLRLGSLTWGSELSHLWVHF